ncbi:MAG: limonene-1,2-epoxide hydrolase family protein [Tepidiformaceae bacterium]
MTDSNETIVNNFVKEFEVAAPDPETVGAYFTDDAVYHNIPMAPINGKKAIMETIAGWKAMMACNGWEVLNQAASGDVVMNERIDHFIANGKEISLRVVGVFELHDGKITAWRDYFDMAQFRALFG